MKWKKDHSVMPFELMSVLVMLVCGAGVAVGAEKPLVVEVWPGTPPEEPGNIGAEMVRMSPKLDHKQVEVTEQTRLVTNVTKPTLTIYRPPKDKETGTAVLICPGGGYWDLYWQLEGEEVATWLNSIGATGIILKYRVPRRPDEIKGEPARRPLQDAQRAVRLVRSKAAEWGINPQQIGMVGFSAGGHLAIATATSFEQKTYEPVDDVDKTSCRPDFAIGVYSGYLKAKDKDEVAPYFQHIPAGTPPVFLAHGGADLVSPPEHSVLMYLALRKAGVPAELHVYATAAHDFGVRPSDHPCSTWTQACANWLRHQGFLRPLRQALSRERIIEIANAAARNYGWNPGSCTVVFDEGNAAWKADLSEIQRTLAAIPLPERKKFELPAGSWFEGHDYQVVRYDPRGRGPETAASLYVFVDRDTGEVLKVFPAG